MLKPFLPQLQTTFIKALNDPNRSVRTCAAKALQKLIKLHTRVDPLFTELHNGVKNTEDNTIRYMALHSVGMALPNATRNTLHEECVTESECHLKVLMHLVIEGGPTKIYVTIIVQRM